MNPLRLTALLAAITGAMASTHETIENRPCFRSMKGMMDSMNYLAEDHKDLVTITKIGESWLKNNDGRHDGVHEIPDGGYDIFALNITASNSARLSEEKGKMLLTSGVHAREWAPPELLARFIELLVHGYNKDADVTWILEHTEIHAILYFNPDGRFMAEKYPELYWRKNMHPIKCGGGTDYGVDLNRNLNWDFGNQKGSSNNACDGDYHGPGPESEPETQAFADYARSLFPDTQRKDNPWEEKDDAFSEDNTGMYIDIHSSGGYNYYPWGHMDSKSPNNEALEALGRKISSFNKYKLWAGDQPDFLYEASGDTSDWAYGALGVSTFGLEIGDEFQQECDSFESEVVPVNLPALLFAAKTVAKPFSNIKGPDVLDLSVEQINGEVKVSAHVSDGKLVNEITTFDSHFDDFETGAQTITEVRLYLDVHPDDYKPLEGDVAWEMASADGGLDSDEEHVELTLSESNDFSPGRHVLYTQATDSDGYKGPVTSVFVDVPESRRSLRGASSHALRNPSL